MELHHPAAALWRVLLPLEVSELCAGPQAGGKLGSCDQHEARRQPGHRASRWGLLRSTVQPALIAMLSWKGRRSACADRSCLAFPPPTPAALGSRQRIQGTPIALHRNARRVNRAHAQVWGQGLLLPGAARGAAAAGGGLVRGRRRNSAAPVLLHKLPRLHKGVLSAARAAWVPVCCCSPPPRRWLRWTRRHPPRPA